jgi:uncharacterized membrane protein YecN with MAPEG domain
MARALRAHGNAAEWVPLGLILLLTMELAGVKSLNVTHGLGGTFFLARLLHAVGVLTGSKVTVAGAGLNYLSLILMSGILIAHRF